MQEQRKGHGVGSAPKQTALRILCLGPDRCPVHPSLPCSKRNGALGSQNQGQLPGHSPAWSQRGPHTQKGPPLCLMLHHQILKISLNKGPHNCILHPTDNIASSALNSALANHKSSLKGGQSNLKILSSSNMYFLQPIFIHQGIFEEMSLIPGTLIHLHQLSLFRGDLGVM